MKKYLIGGVIALGFAITAHGQQVNLSIATGGTGGVWYPMGGAMANVLSKHMPNTAVTAEVTGGSVDNVKLIATRKTEVGFSMVDVAWEGLNGTGKFKDNKVPMRTLAVVHPLVMHVVSAEGRGIEKIADFKGKRVSTGSPGSGTEVMALRILEAHGINPDKDITRERLSVAEAANALKDRKIDAFMHAAGVPLPAVTDVAATPGIKLKLIDHAGGLEAMRKKYGPIYATGRIPARSYPGQEKESRTINVWGVLLVHESMDEKLAYNILKTFFDRHQDLVIAHRESANMTLENQTIGATAVPWHPGAVKYFADRGVTVK
ncbi:MAG: TAXI family TRAP transporter solute-binding subunit [Betaproteobacteria bacterium]|nr:TAXI family TRAP transporter solute-binding subunit [Betaproteobacteria bacterium]